MRCVITKRMLFGFFIVSLLIVTFFVQPRVDTIEPDVFFYLQNLSPLYFVCVLASIIMAFYWRNNLLGLLSVIVLNLLILLTPSVMFVQPWFLDTYPFVSEAVYVMNTGSISDFHYLSVNPVLGLFFGPFLMITGISPLMLIKVYPMLIAIFFPIIFYLICEKLNIGKENLILAPLLFISIAWPNELHFCRQSFSLIFYLTSWFLMLRLMFVGKNRGIFVILLSQIFLLTISHPSTPLFFISNLVAIYAGGWILKKFRQNDFTWGYNVLFPRILLISGIFWLLWNSLFSTETIYILVDIIRTAVESFSVFSTQVPGIVEIFADYTPIYGLIINTRLALTLAVAICGVLFSAITYRYVKDNRVSIILMGWINSFMIITFIFVYAGLPYFARPALFVFIAWAPIGALTYKIVSRNKTKIWNVNVKKVIHCSFVIVFIILPSLLLPLIKYGSAPFLYSSSNELASYRFLDLHVTNDGILIYFENNLPYGYSYITDGYLRDDGSRSLTFSQVYSLNEGLNYNLVNTGTLWLTSRLATRDAFYNYDPSLQSIIENVTFMLPTGSHNKIYDAGQLNCILISIPDLR